VTRTLFDWYAMGGWVMHCIAGCSVLVLAVALERAIALRPGAVVPRGLVRDLRELAVRGDAKAIAERCAGDRSPLAILARIAATEWLRGDPVRAEQAVETAAGAEASRLSRNLPLLAALANLATLLGLLGTVLGMIDAFELIAAQGSSDVSVVAGGIFRALVTTAAGLSVGIPALAVHALIRRRVEGLIERIEDVLSEVQEGLGRDPAHEALPPRVELARAGAH
jgi:biopolymer transport protein ExbB